MPDERKDRTVTVDGVTWVLHHGRRSGVPFWSRPEGDTVSEGDALFAPLMRIAALEAEREAVTNALRDLASHVARLGVNPTIPDFLAWHRARGATLHTEGREEDAT